MHTTKPLRILAWPAFNTREQNPYAYLLYTHMQGAQVDEFSIGKLLSCRYDVWHIHWPEMFLNIEKTSAAAGLKTQAVLSLMDFARSRGTKIVWTVHNLASHERRYPRIEKWFWRAFLRRLDGFITLSESGLQSARERFPELRDLPGTVVPHGHYRGEYPDDHREDCRERLGISSSAKVVLFFGWIREYKNVPALIAAFRGLSDPQAALCLAGREFQKSGAAKSVGSVRELANGDSRIHLHLRHVPNEEVQTFFGAADLVALPYREILNSGTALLALSFNKPVLVPHKGAMAELQARVGRNWVQTYEGDLTSEQLAEALEWALTENRPGAAPLDTLDWDRVGKQTLAAYRNVMFPSRAGEEKTNLSKQEAESTPAPALHT